MYLIDEASAKAALFSFIKGLDIAEATKLLEAGVPADMLISDSSPGKSGLVSYVILKLVGGNFENGDDGKVAFLEMLIKNGANVNRPQELSASVSTPLMDCMLSQMIADLKLKVLDLLLSRHADPLVTASVGNNLIHKLVQSHAVWTLPHLFKRLNNDVIHQLLHQRNDEGYTPLHAAARAASMGMGIKFDSHFKHLKLMAEFQSDLETENYAQESILKDFDRLDSRHSTQILKDLQAHKIAHSCAFGDRVRVSRVSM